MDELLSHMHRLNTDISFFELHEIIRKAEEYFVNSSTDEHISFIYTSFIRKVDANLFTDSSRCKKDPDNARKLREKGNQAFKSGHYVEALKSYMESVASCPKNSEELALAYGNRSAVLFRLNDFRSSLVDINRAMKGKKVTDEEWVKKLRARKQNCIKNIRSEMSTEDNEQFDEDSVEIDFDNKYPLPKANFKNELIPNASEKIKICVNEEMGRHMVAVKDISPAEILVIEKSYASVLTEPFHHTHCWHCHVRTVSLIPCGSCSSAMFCSLRCQKKAYNLYHRTECQMVPLVFGNRLKENLALRIFLIATKQGEELKNFQKHSIYGKPFQEKYSNFQGKFISEDYFSIHHLSDYREKGDFARFCLKRIYAALLLRVLKENSFFKKIDEKNRPKSNKLTELELFAGTLLLKYLYIIEVNSHSTGETIKLGTNQFQTQEIAVCLLPLLSGINHSCDANVARIHDRNSIILRATQPIRAGEQIFDCYNADFESAKTRREFFKKHYFFECHCVICESDWPSYQELKYTLPEYKSAECKKNEWLIGIYSKEFRKMMSGGIDNVQILDVENYLKFFCSYLTLLDENIKKPWKEYMTCRELIFRIMLRQHLYYTINEDIFYNF